MHSVRMNPAIFLKSKIQNTKYTLVLKQRIVAANSFFFVWQGLNETMKDDQLKAKWLQRYICQIRMVNVLFAIPLVLF